MNPAERDEIETLRERNRQLETLFEEEGRPTYRGLRLSRFERIIVGRLIKLPGICSLDRLGAGRQTLAGNVIVTIHRLRKKLSALNPPIRITTARFDGYYMTSEDKARLLALCEISPKGKQG